MSIILKALQKKRGLRRYIGPKRIILLIILIITLLVAWRYYRNGVLSPAVIQHYYQEHPFLAVILYMSIYALSVVSALPSLPLNLAAGYFWGGFVGGLYATIGVTVGSWISFAIARWLFGQPLAEKFDIKWVSKVQMEFEKFGWRFVAFARINPIIPTGPLNYLLGLTSISNRQFILPTFIFLLLPSILISYIGDALQTFATQQNEVSNIVKGVLIFSAAITVLFSFKYASRILKSTQEKT